MKLQRVELERQFEALRLNLIYCISWNVFASLLTHSGNL